MKTDRPWRQAWMLLVAALAAGAAHGELPAPAVTPEGSFVTDDSLLSFAASGLPHTLLHRGVTLIGGAQLRFTTADGRPVSIALPRRAGKRVSTDAIEFHEALRDTDHLLDYRIAATPAAGAVRILIVTRSETLRLDGLTLRLPAASFSGRQFAAGAGMTAYAPPAAGAQTLLPARPAPELLAAADPGFNFRLCPEGEATLDLQAAIERKSPFYAATLHSSDGRSLGFTLVLPTGGAWAPSHAADRGNLLDNPGFEVGADAWGVTFNGLDDRSSWALDRQNTAEGRNALRIEQTAFSEPGVDKPSAPAVQVISEFVQADPQRQFTFSAALRSSRENTPATLRIHYFLTDSVGDRGSAVIEQPVVVGTAWRRFALTARLPAALNDAYSVSIAATAPVEGQTLWVDAARFAPGAGAEFQAEARCELGVATGQPHNLYAPGDTVRLGATVRRGSDGDAPATLRCRVLGPDYGRVYAGRMDVRLAAGETQERLFSFPAGPRGAYRVYLDVLAADGRVLAERNLTVGVAEATPPPQPISAANRFGANIGGSNVRDTFALMRRIGFTWVRGGPLDESWQRLEPAPGQWNAGAERRLDAMLDLHSAYGLVPIANPTGTPAWASSAPAGSTAPGTYPPRSEALPAYREFLDRFVAAHRGRLLLYEVGNEPNIPHYFRGTAEQYVAMLGAVHDRVKAGDPAALTGGFSITGIETPAAARFVERAIQAGALRRCDAFSWHPYRPGRLGPEETNLRQELLELQAMMTRHDVAPPLWVTEIGWFAPYKFSRPYTPCKNHWIPDRHVSEEECARYYTQSVATCFAHGVEKFIYYVFQEGDYADRWFHGFVGPDARFPKAAYFAAAAAVRHLDRARSLGEENPCADVWLSRLAGPAGPVAVLWKAAGATEIEIATPVPLEFEDLYGNPFRLAPRAGRVCLTLGEDPLYLLNPPPADRFAAAPAALAGRHFSARPGDTVALRLIGSLDARDGLTAQSGILAQPLVLSGATEDRAKARTLQIDGDTVPGETYPVILWLGPVAAPSARLLAWVTVGR